MMLYNQGYIENICEQCKNCDNLKVVSLDMGGHHYYACGKFPLTNPDIECPAKSAIVNGSKSASK